MTEIRWHARAGQGAKTAAQLLAEALLRTGKSVQAFPEYGPERRGAPVRAYTRVAERPIRRRDTVAEPDVVVVLEPSLAHEPGVVDGLRPEGVLLVNADEDAEAPPGVRTVRVPATQLASSLGSRFTNLVMTGAVAAELGEPPLEDLQEAAVALLGSKAAADDVRAAIEKGYEWPAS